MGIEDFTVQFDNPSGVYYAGQVVSGTVYFVTTKPYQSDGVFITYLGKAEVHWTESESRGTGDDRRTETVHYKSSETYFDQKTCLFNPPGRMLQPYNYSFPFALQLPMHIPSSFIGTVGKITYLVRANIHKTGMHLATKVTLPFSVVGIKDLNHFPQLQNPVKMQNEKTFGMLLWKSKPLTAQLTINRQAFVSGENILVSGLINNQSDVKIKECELKLIKNVTYYARGKTKHDKTTVYRCTQPGIDKKSDTKWVNVPVFVPCLPPSGLDGCQIIRTDYILEVRIVPPGLHFALETVFSITLGTIPFRQVAPAPSMPCAGGTGHAPPPHGSYASGPPGNYMPGPPGGYAPEPPGGYAPGPPGGYAPGPPGGYAPGPPGGYAPGPPGGYAPGPPGGYAPGPSGGYAPGPSSGYAPGPAAPPYYSSQAGPLPQKPPISGESSHPSAPPTGPAGAGAPALPPYGELQPTFGEYCSDSTAPPSYDSLFKGSNDDQDHDDVSRNYHPKYPSFNIKQ